MKTAGIVCEYNPFHLGHLYQIQKTRGKIADRFEDTAIVCVMSGNYVQRGDMAIMNKYSRAEAALGKSDGTGQDDGADLVLELPIMYAMASAEDFAAGAIAALNAMQVDFLSFGSEAGELEPLSLISEILLSDEFSAAIKPFLKKGMSFASARQKAVEKILGAPADCMGQPNNILGIEYLKQLKKSGSKISPVTITRSGTSYHSTEDSKGLLSATGIRRRMELGENWRDYVPFRAAGIYDRELEEGRGPMSLKNSERLVLDRLRRMEVQDYMDLPYGGEGLGLRLYKAVKSETGVGKIIEKTKTKRYAHSRIRRMILWAYLDMNVTKMPIPYLRVLTCNQKGRLLLKNLKSACPIPIITRSNQIKGISEAAMDFFNLENKTTDLYTLAYPDLSQAQMGQEWRKSAIMTEKRKPFIDQSPEI